MDASLRGHAAAQYQQQQQQQQLQQQQSHFPSQQNLYYQQQQQQQNQFPSQQQHQQRLHGYQQQNHRGGSSVGGGGGGGSISGQRSHASMSQQHHHQQHNDYMSVGSHFSRGSHASSQTSASVVDEAYRRLGHRLSRRAHGDAPLRQPKRAQRLGLQPSSVFEQYNRQGTPAREGDDEKGEIAGGGANSNGLVINNRTNKVAKTRYSDHGDHQHKTPSQNGNVLKKMTMNCKEYFRQWQAETASSKGKGRKKRAVSSSTQQQPPLGHDPQQQQQQQHQEQDDQQRQPQHPEQQGPQGANVDLSPQRFAFSQLALETDGGQQQQLQQGEQQQHHHHQHVSDQLPQQLFNQKEQNKTVQTHGLLSAVIEQSSQASSRTHSKGAGGSIASRSSSIATKSTIGSRSDMASLRNASALPRGKCLTQPPEPITNDGLDNCEGNLVVFENDTLRIGRKQVHAISKDRIPNIATMDFRIQSLLGQGTFAQVFQCLHLQTGKIVAVKIVKNKPAYTRQAVVEIDVFRALTKNDDSNTATNNKALSSSQSQTAQRAASPPGGGVGSVGGASVASGSTVETKWDYMVNLECYFMYKNHLCLVFELLGLNLYEVLKRRQFRGLPLPVVRTLVRQAIRGVKELAQKSIVHCDLKPENILLVTEDDAESVVSAGEGRRVSSSLEKSKSGGLGSSLEQKINKMEPPAKTSGLSSALGTASSMSVTSTHSRTGTPTTQATTDPLPQSPGNSVATPIQHAISSRQKIKLIDFGSACFEGQTAHTYIQSRFYRSPEVLIGLPYDTGIDTWSLGCVAAELFLGLPILPGVHEHDQLCRISEMITNLPGWMLDAGSKSSKYFVKYVPRPESRNHSNPSPSPIYLGVGAPSPRPQPPQWRVKTQQEYISSLSQSEIRKKGGLAKLEKQPTNRYFKRKKLSDIILHKGQSSAGEDKESLELFVHFLYGLLDPDPWKRWTAYQACQHPFVAGGTVDRRSTKPLGPDGLKDQNHANAIGDIYWEPPWDPGICRRKLLNVQKMRERQQGSRRGYSSNRRSSLSSLDGTEGSAGERSRRHEGAGQNNGEGDSAQHGGTSNGNSAIVGQGQHRNVSLMSSSLSEYGGQAVMLGRPGGDNSSVSGDPSSQQIFPSGPQSFSETASFSGLHSTLNEPDFAYALQRPGVVPMGESVSSSTMDIHSQLQQLQSGAAPYGINRTNQRSQQRRDSASSVPTTSRSYDMNDSGMPGDQWRQTAINARAGALSQMSISSQGSYGNQYDLSALSGTPRNGLMPGSYNEPPNQMAGSYPQDLAIPTSDFQQQHAAYGTAQAYLQQQHAALQQQQALLQQQQAALALQQQQLRAYGINPSTGMNMNGSMPNNGSLPNTVDNMGGMMPNSGISSIPNSGVGALPNFGTAGLPDSNTNMNFHGGMMNPPANVGMNQYGGGATGGGGYYYVSSADGTPMLMSPNAAAGMNQQQQGIPNSYGMGGYQVNNSNNNNMMGGYPPNNYDGTGYPDQGGFYPANSGGNNNNSYRGGMSM